MASIVYKEFSFCLNANMFVLKKTPAPIYF